MIDFGFSKLALIGTVALIVIGPEKMPKVARMAGNLYGRAQRYLAQVKNEVNREIDLDALHNLEKNMRDAAQEVESAIVQNVADMTDHADGGCVQDIVLRRIQAAEKIADKAKAFRKKKLARTTAVPDWYKHRHAAKSHVLSGAARVARYRPSA
ncbi:MAG: Sec-independent protein translocase protein TatB [Burkholderiaceae bacterium]